MKTKVVSCKLGTTLNDKKPTAPVPRISFHILQVCTLQNQTQTAPQGLCKYPSSHRG